jgi:gas vesicle protein
LIPDRGTSKELAVRFIIGLGLGYVVGILIAPAAGSVTRNRMKERMDTKARDKAREIGARAGEMAYEELKQKV